MKVTCEYCGSYVEIDENMKCPLCNAALGTSIQAEQARAEEREEEARQHEAEEKAQDAREGHISEVIAGIASVATAIAAGVTRSNASGEPPSPHGEGVWLPEQPESDGMHMPPRLHGDRRRAGAGAGGFRPHRPR